MARSTGIGSMPGTDLAETAKLVLDVCDDLPFLPELPARGVQAGMIGRTLGLVRELGADLQPDGWRIGVGEGVDQRRARSLLAQDLDVLEELAHEREGSLKVQVTGPVTLAASVELPRGDKVIGDHGARRELTEALTIAVVDHVGDLSRRFRGADLVVQLDEPGLRAAMDARVPTASGYRTHRRLEPAEVDAHLRPLVDAIVAAGATPVVHTCAAGVPVQLLRDVGFSALSFDLSLARPEDAWAEALDAGVQLWCGADGLDGARRIEGFVGALGFAVESVTDRLVVTPSCGLVDRSPDEARATLERGASVARALS